MCPTLHDPPGPTPQHRAAVLAGHAGDDATARSLLTDADPRTRASALSALVRSGAVSGAELATALTDPEPFVRRRAAQDVGRLTGPNTAPSLSGALSDPDPMVVEIACWAAGELESESDVEQLIDIAGHHEDPLCREAAVAALGAIGDERGRHTVVTACSDIATIRRRAVLALAAFDGPESTAMLRRLTADRDLQVRQSAEDLLAIVEGESIGRQPDV